MTDQPPTPPDPTPPTPPPSEAPGDPYAAPRSGQVPPPPPAYPPAPAYGAPPVAPGQWGPPGKPRGIGFAILITIVTLGIYAFYWVWVTSDEVKKHSGQGVGGPLGFLIYLVVSPVTFFLLASEISKMHQLAGRPVPFTWKQGFWVLLPLIGPIVWFVKMQGALNKYWESLGVRG